MDSSFFIMAGQKSDRDYNAVRDEPALMLARNYVEEMWKKYELHAEPSFQKKATEDFHAKIWEMYLGCVLIDNGMNLQVKQKVKGPDLCVRLDDRHLWIEAIAPKSGTGDNAVPEVNTESDEAMDVPEKQILLRLTGAIEEKYKKYQKYITGESPIIKPKDYYVIAINGGRINFGFLLKGGIPFIVSCAFGLGNEVLTIKGNNVSGSYEYREKINTCAGNPVNTNIFRSKQYSGISAVLYSCMNVANHPNQAGSEIDLVHNPFALPDNSLPLDIFPFGTEWWVENNELMRKKS